MRALDSFVLDVGYGLRLLRRAPGFAALAVLTLALGIAATTAIFSLVNAVLLRDLPYRDPERLVFLYERLGDIPGVPLEAWGPVNADFFTWRKESRFFASMAMFSSNGLSVSAGGEAFQATSSRVTADFFRVLGVSPAIGRTVDEADTEPGNARVAVISHSLWQSRFGGARDVLGKELQVNARSFRIIGVMPPGFTFPHGPECLETAGTMTEIWLAWAMTPEQRASRNDSPGNAIGRLRPGVKLSQAQAEIGGITARFDPAIQELNQKPQGVVRAFDQQITGGSRRALLIFTAAVLLVLLIACSNVAGLGLARAGGRAQEIGVRAALGASRARLVRQLLAECLCVGIAGGVLGMAAAFGIVRLLAVARAVDLPRMDEVSIDWRVLLFTIAISLGAAVLSGLVPAWSGSRSNLSAAMKSGGSRGVKGGAGRLHGALIVGEMALTIVLLTGSGLLIRSFLKLRAVDKGFESLSTLTMGIRLDGRYSQPQQQRDFFQTLLERVRAVPGIEEVAAANHIPLGGGESLALIEVEGFGFDRKTPFEIRSVTPQYFAALGIPLLEGREFDDGDADGRAPVIIVSRSFERRFFPGRSALGRRVHTSGWRTIVGVVADVRMRELDTTPPIANLSAALAESHWRGGGCRAGDAAAGAGGFDCARSATKYGPRAGGGGRAHDGRTGFASERDAALPNGPADGLRRRRAVPLGGGFVCADGVFGGTPNRGDRHSHGARRAAERGAADGAGPWGGAVGVGDRARFRGRRGRHAVDAKSAVRSAADGWGDVCRSRGAVLRGGVGGMLRSGAAGDARGCGDFAAVRMRAA